MTAQGFTIAQAMPEYKPTATYGKNRRCASCSTVLSVYNPNTFCGAHSPRQIAARAGNLPTRGKKGAK